MWLSRKRDEFVSLFFCTLFHPLFLKHGKFLARISEERSEDLQIEREKVPDTGDLLRVCEYGSDIRRY